MVNFEVHHLEMVFNVVHHFAPFGFALSYPFGYFVR